ncbi:ATP-binding protein [Streptomyces sp. NBC_01445]|uniref:ATP-binding protein n=1 Tax=Streptomyces sp. NBC_01445 TaxID=2903869 RepID=UPI002DD7D31B|nr:ATP-binding protein [Streptomyces sp. NBC_01445]WSE03893.1 ATP-binding protein [Streptomyces sp. NBC_01445]
MQHPLTVDDHHAYPAEALSRPQKATDARDAASCFLACLHPAPPAPTTQDLLLLVSELVTNARRHAGSVTALHLNADRRHIHVTVDDPSPAHPQDRSTDLSGGAGGIGWPMIRRLARTLTIHPQPGGGKSIHATLPR